MWETTFPRNSHAGLGRDFTEIHPYSEVCSVRKMAYQIRRGYFSEMLFPTWGTSCRRLVLLYLLARRTQDASSHLDRFDSPVDVRCLVLCEARRTQDASSHLDRFDSPVDVRYLIWCDSWPEEHKWHHRTSTDSIRQSMCDV